MGTDHALRGQPCCSDAQFVESRTLLSTARCQSLQRIVDGPAGPLLLADLGVERAEPNEQLHVCEAHVPALPLAQRDAAAELVQRLVDAAFERQDDGATTDPLRFEKGHLSGRVRKALRGGIERSSRQQQTILSDGLVDQHQECADAQRRQRGIRLAEGDCFGARLERAAIVAPAVDASLGERRRRAQKPLGWPCRCVNSVLLDDVGQARDAAAAFVRGFAGLGSEEDPAGAVD
jgi:hypothetical protein